MLTNGHVWREAQERLRPQMTRAQFDTWLRGTRLAALDGDVAVLAVRTTFGKELLESQYRERIEAALAEVAGTPYTLRVVVGLQRAADDATSQDGPAATMSNRALSSPPSGAAHESRERHTDASDPSGYIRPGLFDTSPATPAEDVLDALAAEHRAVGRSAAATTAKDTAAAPPVRGTPGRTLGNTRQQPPAAGGGALAITAGNGHRRDAGAEGRAPMRSRGDGRSARDDYDDEAPENRYPSGSSPAASGANASNVSHPFMPAPRLNPRYTFKTYIVGGSNRLAYAASVAVGEAPGQEYNPLFLYGEVGLGKTHLLHAIGHAAAAQGLAVLYVTSETFTNEIINAIMRRTTDDFRAKYRSVDVLLVDDIQFIAGKDSTEEEFFHTFNSLYESGRQIVICSDRPPKGMVTLQERLRSRFEWGLIADIQLPDFETRVAILRAKAEMIQRHVPDDVIDYLADRVQSNIRELEGSLNRLLAFSTLQRQPLNVELAKAALANLASDARTRKVTIKEVLAAVAEFYHLAPEVLCGKQRDKHIVVPRQVAMYLMREETEASLLEVGQALGGRDHSTVLHGHDKIAREMNENPALRKEVVTIRQRLVG
jgi:chromosomal replication initiator protein